MIKLLTAVSLLSTVVTEAANKVYTVTAYCACQKCCGPNAIGLTTSGKPAREGITIAAPHSIPFGTKLQINGIGKRVVQDRLANRYDNRIDVFMTDHRRAKQFGKKTLTVKTM